MKLPRTVFFTPEQHERLNKLSEQTGIPVSVLVRRGVDKLLDDSARHESIATSPKLGEGSTR